MNMRVLILVALITAFAPLSMDLYLPGLPDLRAEFGATQQQAQLTVTGCIAGLAFGQFLTGLVPDRIGRRRPLMIGMAAWIAVTFLCALAPTIWAVLGLRLLQGTGAGLAIALARAVVADLDPDRLSQHLSRMMLVLSVVPVLAPALGGLIVSVLDWRGLFVGLAVTGVVLLGVMTVALPESRPPSRAEDSAHDPLGPMRRLLRSRQFLLPALISGTGFGVTFSFIGDSSFVLRDHYGLAPIPYGLIFGLDALAMIAGFQLGPVLERRLGTNGALRAATAVGVVGAAAMLLAALLLPALVVPVVIALMLVLLGGGMVIPLATAAAIDVFPDEVAAGSGLTGALQFLIGGAIGMLPAVLPLGEGAGPLAVVCLGSLTAGLLLSRRLRRAPRRGFAVVAVRELDAVPCPGGGDREVPEAVL